MTGTVDAFPLQWPHGVPRTPAHRRRPGQFMVTPAAAIYSLTEEITRSGGTDIVISSDVPVRQDGLPYARAREPDDPGVAVYFTRKGKQLCIPCDAFDRAWKNIRALALSIRDMRGPESRGCAAITDQAFTGFLALPSPSTVRPWRDVMGVPAGHTVDLAKRYKELAILYSNMGDQASLSELNVARDQAREEGYMG